MDHPPAEYDANNSETYPSYSLVSQRVDEAHHDAVAHNERAAYAADDASVAAAYIQHDDGGDDGEQASAPVDTHDGRAHRAAARTCPVHIDRPVADVPVTVHSNDDHIRG